jgi:hypothetical protein
MTVLATPIETPALKDIAAGLNAEQARWLVDYYYAIQDYRIQATGQVRAVTHETDDASFVIGEWLADRTSELEREIVKALDIYTNKQTPGLWAKSIIGIGPVIAAGLLAHIDITKAPTVGHIWGFAGLDPTTVWEKGQKRPWNAKLKVLCWKIGDSFVKQQSREKDIYGKVYVERKKLEVERNEAGLFADQAAHSLATRNIRDKDLKATYEAGRLPAGRLDLRARRYAVKLFLAHLHHVMYEDHFGELPPKPYIIQHGGHTHYIEPPNWKNGTVTGR